MLELKSLLIAEAATSRNNLISVLEAGVSRLSRTDFPALFAADIALTFEADPEDAGRQFHLRVEGVRDEGEETIFAADIDLSLGPATDVGFLTAALALPLHQVGLPGPGGYKIRVSVDQTQLGSLRFRVDHVTAQAMQELISRSGAL